MAFINLDYLFNKEEQKCSACGYTQRTTLLDKLGLGDGGLKFRQHMDTHGVDENSINNRIAGCRGKFGYKFYRIKPCLRCKVNLGLEYGHKDCMVCHGNEQLANDGSWYGYK